MKQSLIIACVGIFGVILGSLVSGYFVLESSKNNTDALINSISRQHAQYELEIIRKKSEDFIHSYLETIIAIENDVSDEVVSNLIHDLYLKSYSFILYTNNSLSLKSIKLTQKLNEMTDSKLTNNSQSLDSLRNSMTVDLIDWMQEARSEISSYKIHSMPDKMKSDIKQKLIEAIIEYE